jgi:hypothetical protein
MATHHTSSSILSSATAVAAHDTLPSADVDG